MKQRIILTGTVFFVFLLFVPSEGTQYKYYSKGKRDPFVPLVTGEVRTSLGLAAVEDVDDVRLEGIIYDPSGKSMVVLNDEVLKEGDKLYNVEVVKIDKNSVTIKVHDRVHTIKLVEEGGGES